MTSLPFHHCVACAGAEKGSLYLAGRNLEPLLDQFRVEIFDLFTEGAD
jgi:hypothetical protein